MYEEEIISVRFSELLASILLSNYIHFNIIHYILLYCCMYISYNIQISAFLLV